MDKTSWTCSIKYIKCKITSPPQQWIFIWLKFQSKDLNRMQGRVPRPRGAGSCRGPRKAGRAVRLYRLLAGRRLYTCVHPSSALWQIVFFYIYTTLLPALSRDVCSDNVYKMDVTVWTWFLGHTVYNWNQIVMNHRFCFWIHQGRHCLDTSLQ